MKNARTRSRIYLVDDGGTTPRLFRQTEVNSLSHRRPGRGSGVLQFVHAACQCFDLPQSLDALGQEHFHLSLRRLFQVRHVVVFRYQLAVYLALELGEVVRVPFEDHAGLEVQPVSVQLHQTKR